MVIDSELSDGPDSRHPDGGPVAAKPEVSVIVISYGAREMTIECLCSIERGLSATLYEAVVVDNASTDGTPEAIAEQLPSFHLIRSPSNLGYASACNLAARHARGRYFLFLNPDTVVIDGAIEALLRFARRHPDAGIWGGRTVFADGRLNPTSCWRRQSLWTLFCSATRLSRWFPKSSLFGWHAYGGWLRDSERTVDIVTGCFLLIDRSLWERLDGFATDFFMYGEDADLCLRARRLGFRPAVTPDATIIHHGSGTETDKARKITQILAASALLIRRHFSWRARCLGLLLLAARPGLAVLLSKRAFRPIWKDVWTRRHIWLAGKY